MFFDSVKLSRSGWYIRLLHYVFPSVPLYNNFCPIFWLVLLAAMLFIPVALGKGLLWLMFILASLIARSVTWLENNVWDPYKTHRDENFVANYSPIELALAKRLFEERYGWEYLSYDIRDCERKRLIKLWEKLRDLPNKHYETARQRAADADPEAVKKWFAEQAAIAERFRQREHERWQKKQERDKVIEDLKTRTEKANREFFNKLISLSKLIGPIFIAAVVAFIGYWLVMSLGWCWYWLMYYWNWDAILATLAHIGLAVVIGAVLVSVIYGLVKLCSIIFKNTTISDTIYGWLCSVGKFFSRIGEGFGSGWDFVVAAFKMFKSNNCPHVDWVD